MLIDEVHKMTQEAFGFLNEVRSSGRAKITKIGVRRDGRLRVRLLLDLQPEVQAQGQQQKHNEMSSYRLWGGSYP